LIPLVTFWARNVPNDFWGDIFRVVVLGFFFHGGEGAEELVGDVGQDGGASGRDAVLGEKEQEAGEEVVDGGGGGEFGEAGGEGGGEIGGLAAIFGELGVAGTIASVCDFFAGEAGRGRSESAPFGRELAALAIGEAVLASG